MLVKLRLAICLPLLCIGSMLGQATNSGTPSADVRDSGVDVTGVTDSSTKLQTAVTAACGSNGGSSLGLRLSAPAVTMKISSTINFTQCGGMDFGGASSGSGFAGQGLAINWATSGGTMFLPNRTRDSTFENMTLSAIDGSHLPNVVFDLDENSGSGILSHNLFRNISIGMPGGSQNANFRGFRIGQNAPGNTEQQVFQDVNVNCGGGTITDTSNGIGWAINNGTGTAQPFYLPILRAEVSGCSHGVEVANNTRDVIVDGGNYGPNFHSLYLRGGGNVAFENITTTTDVSSSIFLNGYAGHLWVKNNAFTGPGANVIDVTSANGGAKITVEHNDFGGGAMFNGTFTPGSRTGFLTAIGNSNFTTCPDNTEASFGIFLLNIPTAGGCANWFIDQQPFIFTDFVIMAGLSCTNGELALSAGWGTTATATGVVGQGQTCGWTITASGTGQAANPTITDTLTRSLPSANVVCDVRMVGGTGTATLIDQTTLSATAPVFTFGGTPGAGSTYKVVRRCGP